MYIKKQAKNEDKHVSNNKKRKMRSYVIVIVCVQKIIPPPTNCKIFKLNKAKHKKYRKNTRKIIYNMLYLYTAILVKISDLLLFFWCTTIQIITDKLID